MKAVVFHDVGDVRLEEVGDPKIQDPTDAIVRLTASAICGTDLHMVRGTMSAGMKRGTILGHEGVGIVEEIGRDVRNLQAGDRVVIPSTIACGVCAYCRAGYYSQCDNSNPSGGRNGAGVYGGPKDSGGFHGLQAEYARIPHAHVNLVKLPEEISDEQAILLSDIFPTGYFAADIAEIRPGHTLVVFGCGPVGQFAIASAKIMGVGRVFAVDGVPTRLEMARGQGAEIVNFNQEDAVETILRLTGGIGVDRAIDAVGVDAASPSAGPAAKGRRTFERELADVAPRQNPQDENWKPGDAPTQVLDWAVEALAKAGTLSIVGAYPASLHSFPIGEAMNKNLTLRMGVCNHRKYIPRLIQIARSGVFDPASILTQQEPLTSAIEAYKAFDRRDAGWIKVELFPEE